MGSQVRGELLISLVKLTAAAKAAFGVDLVDLELDAEQWLPILPERYQPEARGLADGSGCSLESVLRWIFLDAFIGCTSFVVMRDGVPWVGRNNDYIGACMWDHVSVIAKEGVQPVMLFGLGADLFSGTGYNQQKLWLHYNWLPIWEAPATGAQRPYVFLRMALESCQNLADVEDMLERVPRDGGMNLFAVDGKDNSVAVFECTGSGHVKREFDGAYIAGANHFNVTPVPASFTHDFTDSIARQEATQHLLRAVANTDFTAQDLRSVLADPAVEQNTGLTGTVYANVACPSTGEMWYACNGFPAASRSTWQQLNWAW